MSGNVTSIFARQQTPAAAPAHGPLARLLRQQSIDLLHVQLKAMFDCADDTLFDWARRATGDEQRRCMGLMRVLRVRRPDVVDHFFKSFCHRFDHPESKVKKTANISIDELSMQSTEELEESIAVTNMTARAEGLFRDQLFELGRRLDWAADNTGERVEHGPLEPLAISEAFLAASRTIDMEIETRLVVLKLFERTVMIQLGELYNRLLRALDENGVKTASSQRQAQDAQDTLSHEPQTPHQMSSMLSALGALAGGSAAAAADGGARRNDLFSPPSQPGYGAPAGGYYPPPGAMPAPGASLPPGMVPPGMGALPQGGYGPTAFVAPPGAYTPTGAYGLPLPPGYAAYAGYTDARLASELGERLSSWLHQPQNNTAQEPIAKRAELIGHMFDGFQNDAALPESVKPVLETLRFPVLKAALSDPAFLTNGQHPLRVLLNDLAATASSARTSSHDPTADLQALKDAMAPLLTPDAPVVRANIDSPAPVTDEAVQSFLGQMDEDAAQRRKVIVQRGMQRVDEELGRVLESRELLATAELLIDRALRPFLGLTLLRHSAVSPLWTQSLNLAERVIRSVELARAAEFSNSDRATVRDDLEDALVLERMPRERNQEAISSLKALHNEIEAYLEKKAPAPKAVAKPREPAKKKALRDFLTLGAWFRVFNRKTGETHWMRLLEHEPDVDFIVFGGFDAENRLLVPPKDFEEDLVSRRSDPLDPPPAFESALAAARRQVEDAASDAISASQARTEAQSPV
ncbi:MAG: DUF1631 family protein [Nevskiaceae bacterium]|nr:MAG: DUF1631 family protein [Nevskiaceae bacterium]